MRPVTLALLSLASLTACLGPVVQHASPDGAAPPDASESDAPGPLLRPDTGYPIADGGLRQCTAVGCADSVRLPGVLTLGARDITALSMRLCRNDVCAMGAVTRLPTAPGTGVGCGLTGNPEARCTVWATEDGRYRLDLGFGWQTNLRDGDRYELRVLHVPTGTVLAEAVGLATYATSTPNGSGCEPTCQTATLDVTRREIPTATPARDEPARCFEILPGVVPPSASVTPPQAHTNPMGFDLAAAAGERVTATLLYYNFCADPDPRLLGVDVTSPDGGLADPSFTFETTFAVGERLPMSMIAPQLLIHFRGGAAGTYRARVRVRFAHGYYDNLVAVTVRP